MMGVRARTYTDAGLQTACRSTDVVPVRVRASIQGGLPGRAPAAASGSLEQAVMSVWLLDQVVDPFGHAVQLGYQTAAVDPPLYVPTGQTPHLVLT